MTVSLFIEAENTFDLYQKALAALQIGAKVDMTLSVGPAGATSSQSALPDIAEMQRGHDSADPNEPQLIPGFRVESPAQVEKRKRRTKAEMEAERAALNSTPGEVAQAVEQASTSIFDDEPELPFAADSPPKITADMLRKKFQVAAALQNGAGLRDVVPILEKHGYTRIKDVKPEHYEAVAADVDALVKDAA